MSGKRLSVGVLISGRGSNLQALIDACADPAFPARIAVVVSNKADAYGLERARLAGIATAVVDHKSYDTREAFEAALDATLRSHEIELICLAGFMRILTSGFVHGWTERMINIHPSLLPSFKGLHTHERTIASGVRITGCTVHFVRPEMDDGPIIIQAAVPVLAGDDADSLGGRVLEQEHKIYPEALRLIALSRVRVEGDVVVISAMGEDGRTLVNPPVGG
ncbi:phosphoribosylglycinamide formyltransferase [Govanella unica]|uniref:Phosphoribosylglycinamide formyltransferase n=1 Tax=Govanella unica TaxID=2975056 RepID=A0A9X3Z7L5_9PROT|nr:phosphoribosylglycinamide formyltransferase [Govania unica]MDA5194370.1 phosphoribosylglycinamide formyltransferase [Govania unica]